MFKKFLNKTKSNWYLIDINLIISFGIIGSLILISSMEFINFYLSLELYTFSSIILILLKENKSSSKISIIYFIVNALSTIIIIIGICIIYKWIGIFNIIDIENIYKYFQYILLNKYNLFNNETNFLFFSINPINIILLGFIIKLGSAPFHYIILILYDSVPTIITFYQSIFPKLIYCFVLLNFFQFINETYTFYFYIILSLICGAILGLNNNKIKKLLASSTIVNIGFILLGLINTYYFYICFVNIENNITTTNELLFLNYEFLLYKINILHYLILYIINVIGIFYILLLFNNIEYLKTLKNIYILFPFVSFYIIITISSLIGIPPFAGFYAKLFIFYNSFFIYNTYIIYIIIIALLTTLISSIYYLYFIKYLFNNESTIYIYNNIYMLDTKPNSMSIILSFIILFIIIFPLISFYFISIFQLYLI